MAARQTTDRPDQLLTLAAKWAREEDWTALEFEEAAREAWDGQPRTSPVHGGWGGPSDMIGKRVVFGEHGEKRGVVERVSPRNTAEVEIREEHPLRRGEVFIAHWLICKPLL